MPLLVRRNYVLRMDNDGPQIIRTPIPFADVISAAQRRFGDMVKAAVDVGRGVMALGGELHSDEEALLLEDGARQADVWDVNMFLGETGDAWIEFDSMINVRPSANNRTRGVDDPAVQSRIRAVVDALITR
jgi:Protein of unknown function (DUF5674)